MKADRLRRYDEESSRELPTKFDVLGGALVLLAFIGCGIAGGYIADAIAHPDSDYAYGDGLGRLILGFFIGAIAGGLLTGAGWTALERRRWRRRSR